MSEQTRATLGVYLGAEPIGTLERLGPTRYALTYDDRAVQRHGEGAVVLSASLPVRSERYPNAQTKPFFEGLLPEGVVRQEIARTVGVSEANGFGLLEALGADCAGAVVVLGPETAAERAEGEIRWLTEDEIAERLRELPRRPLGAAPDEGIRLSLAGAQHKLLITRAPNGRMGQPVHGTPSTHIVKPGQDAYPDVVANEAFCLRVASCAGLDAAHTEIQAFGGIETLVIERYDRTFSGSGTIVRLHQEDFCQALGILPAAKYEQEGGPSFSAIAGLLRELGSARDLGAFARAVLVAFLLGNSDAHGKNFALLYDEPGRVRLAPVYDIVSTAVYPELTTRLAMSVAGVDDPARVRRPAWDEMLRDAGYGTPSGQLQREVGRILDCARAVSDIARAEGWYRPLLDEIVTTARARAEQLTG